MLLLRKIVFYLFSLIYLILCPLIVARMLGFVYNPLSHRLVKTGLVYVSTNPPQANIYIDGRLANQKTPTVIRDLTPGNHFMRIELNGYNDWERNIPIVGKRATVLANVLLIPQEWPVSNISQKPYQNIFIANDDILIASNTILKDMDIYHTTISLQENFNRIGIYERYPLFSNKSIYADSRLIRLLNRPPSPFVLLETVTKDRHKFLWINVQERPPLIEDITELFEEIPMHITWNNTDNQNIFVFYPGHIYRINIKDKAIFPITIDKLPPHVNIPPYTQIKNKFLINDKNDLIIREGSKIRLYPKENFGNPEVYDIAEAQEGANMYFEEKNGVLFYLDKQASFLSTAQILPYRPILNIPIPDALRIKFSQKEIRP